MNLAIDIGNTRVKVAVFEQNKIVELLFFDRKKIISEVQKIVKKYSIANGIIANVATLSEKKIKKLQEIVDFKFVSSSIKIPFTNLYETPKTLGVDRIALVAGAVKQFPKKNVLVIDAGTCITFDFVNSKSEYLGGAISPGIQLRYKALNKFTANLPLITSINLEDFIGKNTNESIISGVLNGVLKEIDGVITDYKNKYLDLTVLLTGGDINFLSKQLKSSIFANQNLLLQGLNEILIFNK
ncbi:type III pantothenate kinase [Polaribacter aestuariivivens]|uniref:Type III pantothenate kinase n=1 Tax=Polaribacter aestuariivivens TaxID=2304626 RepID=A0A5S3NFD4_9FLAO|nr:type III pantothenate kinase [Polaribacter aestuariivivens]TMM32086.1 type III pantothenate kinase [Polaribacter aestuariivivens]